MAEEVNNLFDEKGAAKPGFSGIGKLRGRTDYNESERVILNYFFTRCDSNVYAATDAMPDEVWGQLMGQYARSDMTARDRFLKLIEDVRKKDETAPSISSLAEAIRKGAEVTGLLEKAMARAGRWIEEFGIDYGHASLRDSGIVRMCFEGVSQRATKFLESAREGAYQEQSTRAVPFTIENLGVPFEIRGTEFENAFLELGRGHIELYQKIMDCVPSHLNRKYQHLRTAADEEVRAALKDPNEKLPDKLWTGILQEKSFDVARYLLPQFITTSLGVTLNARRFQDQLTEWQSSEFAEIQALGKAAQAEAMRLNPNLMKYGNKSEFVVQLPGRRRHIYDEFVPLVEKEYGEYPINSTLISSTPNIENLVLASILLVGGDGSVSFEDLRKKVAKLSLDERRKIVASQFQGKQPHDLIPKSMEIGSFVFERLYDIGAYRDLQRQRGDRQQTEPYGMIGYSVPEEVKEIGLAVKFEERMLVGYDLYYKLFYSRFRHVAEYVPAMANLVRHVVTKDPVQCFYEAKLRTQPAGIDSYRLIAQQEIEQVLKVMPAFAGFVEYDPKRYELNRLPEKTKGYIRTKIAKKS
jgi:thymidylate synthase ThyX